MRVHFRVMTPVEAWVREGNRMWWCKALAFVAGGYGALAASLRALLWALDVEREEEVPDSLLLGEFPGLYGQIEREMFYPEVSVPGVGEGVGGHGVRVRGGPARDDRATKAIPSERTVRLFHGGRRGCVRGVHVRRARA